MNRNVCKFTIGMGDHEMAAKLLTEMGALAMEHHLRRQLGRALHLLGELHLRRERPELGTQHLAEAFVCFMGLSYTDVITDVPGFKKDDSSEKGEVTSIYENRKREIYEEEAEQSRLMMAISAGQEHMASYFYLLKEAGSCAIAQMRTIEWKLSHAGWWVKRQHHDYLPCICQMHNRTPLDILRLKLQQKEEQAKLASEASALSKAVLMRNETVENIQMLRSSYRRVEHKEQTEIIQDRSYSRLDNKGPSK